MTHSQPSFAGFIGTARADITPPAGIYSRNWGAAEKDVADSVHRPLTLTCVTFQSRRDEAPLVLISADLGWWKSRDDEAFVRGGVLEALSLDESRCMFCLSHTHAGPAICREDAPKPGGEHIAPYLDQLRAAAARAAKEALATAAPATLVWRYGSCDLATNRDLGDPQRDRCIVGFNPAQSADDTLLVGRVTDHQGTTLATIVNYACHPTTLAWDNRLISPDYIGAMREIVEAGGNAPCLFLQGASGELAPAEQYSGDAALADAHGRRLGYAVRSMLEGMLPAATRLAFTGAVESGAALAIWKREQAEISRVFAVEKVEVALDLKPMPTTAEIEAEWRRTEDRVMKERLWRKRGVRRIVGDGSSARMGLWCWRLGDALLFGHPHEAYSAMQTTLRAQFPAQAVAVMNIVNGYASYLPPQTTYDLDLYPVTVTPFAAGSLERLINAATQTGSRLVTSISA